MAAAGASQLLPFGKGPHHSQLGISSSQPRMSLTENEAKSAAKLERERDRALASIAFMEREQDRVLHGLHQVGRKKTCYRR